MGTLTLPCSGGTFLSYVFPTADNTGLTSFPTCAEFMRVRNASAEDRKVELAYRNRIDTRYPHTDFGGCILEFDYNTLLNYKNINSATLHFTYQSASNVSGCEWVNGGSNRYPYWHEKIYAYRTNKTLDEINLQNFEQQGSLRSSRYEDLHNIIPTGVTSYARSVDVLHYCGDALVNNKIRFLISAGPTRLSWSTTYLYQSFDGAAEHYFTESTPSDQYVQKSIDRATAYLEVDYSDIPAKAPTPLSPISMGLNPNRNITFSWRYNSDTPATQASATIQYRTRGSGVWTTATSSGSGTSWTLSGGLGIGNYEWRVRTTDSVSMTSAYSAVQYFNIVAQSAPTAVYPSSGLTLMEGQDITFTWIYNSLTPARQASATVKYSIKGSGSWTSYTSNSGNPYCTIQNLPQGNYEWKVSIVNEYGEASSDSNVLEFNIIGRPQAPIILTPANCCLTTISWNASGQESAEIMLYKGDELLVHETIATAVTSYKPQMFLKGTYKVKVRIKNNSDLWSDFRELTFTINAAGPTKGTLIATPLEDRVVLNGTHSSTNVALVRIEDGEETIIAMSDSAVDDTVAGNTVYTYVVRSWNTGGYTDSDIKVVECDFIGSIIKGDSGELHLDKSDTVYIPHEETFSGDYAALKFVGREYPVVETDNFTNSELAKRFHVTREQSKVLNKLAKEKSVFYRDNRGNAYKAKITGLKYSNYLDTGYLVEMSFIRTAPSEVIINV